MNSSNLDSVYVICRKNEKTNELKSSIYVACKSSQLNKLLSMKLDAIGSKKRNMKLIPESNNDILPQIMSKILQNDYDEVRCPGVESNRAYHYLSKLIKKQEKKKSNPYSACTSDDVVKLIKRHAENFHNYDQVYEEINQSMRRKLRREKEYRLGGLRFNRNRALRISQRCMSPNINRRNFLTPTDFRSLDRLQQ